MKWAIAYQLSDLSFDLCTCTQVFTQQYVNVQLYMYMYCTTLCVHTAFTTMSNGMPFLRRCLSNVGIKGLVYLHLFVLTTLCAIYCFLWFLFVFLFVFLVSLKISCENKLTWTLTEAPFFINFYYMNETRPGEGYDLWPLCCRWLILEQYIRLAVVLLGWMWVRVCVCVSLFRHSNWGLITKGTTGSPVVKKMLEYKQKRNNGRTPFAGVYKFVCVCVWCKQIVHNIHVGFMSPAVLFIGMFYFYLKV